MKNFFLCFFLLTLVFSCSKDNESSTTEKSKSDKANYKSSATIVYLMNYATTSPQCSFNSPSPQTNDVELQLSSPLEHYAIFDFSVQIKSSPTRWSSIPCPWRGIAAQAGQQKIILNASCFLPDFIPCGKYTEVITKVFRIKLTSARYINTTDILNLTPEDGTNYFDTEAYKYCFGSGWTPGS